MSLNCWKLSTPPSKIKFRNTCTMRTLWPHSHFRTPFAYEHLINLNAAGKEKGLTPEAPERIYGTSSGCVHSPWTPHPDRLTTFRAQTLRARLCSSQISYVFTIHSNGAIRSPEYLSDLCSSLLNGNARWRKVALGFVVCCVGWAIQNVLNTFEKLCG